MATTEEEVRQEREGTPAEPVETQAEKLARISAERQARAGATLPNEGESFVDAQSRGRQASIVMPDTSPMTSEGREARLAASPDFNSPYRTDEQGVRQAVSTVEGAQGQRASTRPPQAVRDILMQGGPSNQREATRLRRFQGTTSGQNFDFGGFRESLAKLRRGVLGQPEFERQMDAAFRESPVAMSPTTTSRQSTATPPQNLATDDTPDVSDTVVASIAGGLQNVVDSSTADSMVAELDTPVIDSIFSTPEFA